MTEIETTGPSGEERFAPGPLVTGDHDGPPGPDDRATPHAKLATITGFDRFSGLYALAVIIAFFSIIATETFFTTSNLKVILSEQAITAMIAFAALVPLVVGQFDLSVAQILGATALLCADLQAHGMNPILAIVVTLAVALAIGGVNAFVVVRLNVGSFIATLGMTAVLQGLSYLLTNGQDVPTGLSHSFVSVGQSRIVGVSSGVLFMIAMGAILWFVLERRPVGRYMYAIGDNPRAAELTGIRAKRLAAYSFLISAFLAGVTGIIYAATVGGAQLSTGPGYLLPAFAACFLGATQIINGRFNVLGTIVAVFLLATGIKGLQLTVTAPWVQNVFTGALLIISVALAERGRARV